MGLHALVRAPPLFWSSSFAVLGFSSYAGMKLHALKQSRSTLER